MSYAGVNDLPAELITRIVEILSGRQPESWGGNRYKAYPPLHLSNRELGNCSLICKYWAKILRPEMFRRLVLRTAEDGRLLHSFVESPARPELAIGPFVWYIKIECNLGDQPWLHLVLMSREKFVNTNEIHIELLNSSGPSIPDALPIHARTIHHSLPRPLPPSMTRVKTLHLRGLSFANYPSLGRFVRSIGLEGYEVRFTDIRIKDPETFSMIGPSRFWTRGFVHVDVKGCEAPLGLLRALLSARPNPKMARSLHMQPHTLLMLEKMLYSVMQVCPSVKGRASVGVNGIEDMHRAKRHRYCRGVSYDVEQSEDFEITVEDWCKEGPTNSMKATVSESGIHASLQLYVRSRKRAKSFPWNEIDESIRALGPEGWRLDLKISVWPYESLARTLYQKMPRLARAGRLQVWYCETFGDIRLYPVGQDQVDREEAEEDEEFEEGEDEELEEEEEISEDDSVSK